MVTLVPAGTGAVPGQQLKDLLGLLHDLRQPVAAMRLALGTLRDGTELPDDVAWFVERLDGYATWMSVLLQRPLPWTAATPTVVPHQRDGADGGRHQRRRAVADLDQVARTCASDAGPHPATVYVESAGPVPVAASPVHIRRALGNLVDNALRAAGPVGTVRVWVGEADGWGVVRVDDDGPGFGRVGSGSGLGLGVVAQVALDVGGELRIGSSDLGGLSVSLALPSARRTTSGTLP